MKRLGLLVAATAVPVMAAGCGTAPGVPEWKSGMPASAAPGVAGSVPAPAQPTQTAAPSPAATPAATTPTATGSAGDPGSDERFVAAVRGQLPEVAVDRRPEEIAEIGGAACTSLAAGQQRAAAAAELTGYGVTTTDARELVTLARAFLCRT